MSESKKELNESSIVLQEVFAAIAHQWRQPLSEINSIVGSIDNRLYEKKIDDPLITELLLKIESVTKRMSQSIDEHRGYLQEKKREISLQDLITQTLESLSLSLQESGVEYTKSIDDSAKYFGDAALLKQILVTLLDNARDALVSRNIYQPMIKIEAGKDRGSLFIKVCDNAGGMSKSVMQKIFEPKFTTKHSSEGTGLGLFRVKKLLEERLGGSLSVKNVGSGVCFELMMPKDEKR